MRRAMRPAALAGALILACTGLAVAEGANGGTGGGPAKDPTSNGGNAVVNQGQGSGTGTAKPHETGSTAAKPAGSHGHAEPKEHGKH